MNIKKTYILLMFLSIFTISLIILFLVNLNKANTRPEPVPSTMPWTKPNPNIEYKTDSMKKDRERLEKRKSLSPADQTAADKLFKKYGKTSNTFYETPLFRIDYIEILNDFEVEILTNDVDKAKNAATQWFKNQGFSLEGICNFPVSFYIGSQTRESLTKKIIFDPNPEGCR